MPIALTTTKTRIQDDLLLRKKISDELKELRTSAGISMDQLADVFGEQRASIHKLEHGLNHITLMKYLSIVWYLREFCPGHPAINLVKAIGPRRVSEMANESSPTPANDHTRLRLVGYLEGFELTRRSFPLHPALALADHVLYD